MSNITISYITAKAPEYNDVWQLREEVLRKPLGLSLKDGDQSMDTDDVIFIAKEADKVVGCLMLHSISTTIVKFRQMAVAPEYQGKGIGKMIVNAAEKFVAEQEYATITLHARQVVMGFYESLGYNTTSSVFTEVGIPHVIMKKSLGE